MCVCVGVGVGCARVCVWCSVCACMRACVCVRARVCACELVCVRTCAHSYMRVCACVYVRACMGVSLLVNLAAMSHSKLCRSTHGYCTYMQSPHTRGPNRNLQGTYSTLQRQRMHTTACFIFRQVIRARGYVGKSSLLFLDSLRHFLRDQQRSSTD